MRNMQDRQVPVMPPERWDRLLRAAAKEFTQAGYERASLNRIIRECGLSKSSFYHYVDSKEQLFDHVLLAYGPALIEALKLPDDAALATDFWAELDGIVVRLLELSAQDSIYGLIGRMCYLPDAPSGGGTALGRGFALVLAWLEHAIDVGRASRAVRDDLPAELQARALLAVARVFDEWSLNHMPADSASQQRLLAVQLAALHRLIVLDQPVQST
jgi:AcrR family transcriptional regulator